MDIGPMSVPSKGGLALAALAVVLAAPMLADVGEASDHVADDEPHVLVQLANDDNRDRDVEVAIDGPDPWSEEVTVPAGETWTHRHPGEPGEYRVEVVVEDEDSQTRGSTKADTAGCHGPTLAPFRITDTGGIAVRGGGCEGLVPGFQALFEEALAARSADADERIDVPMPLDASEGRLLVWSDVAEPNWTEAASVPFAWIANTTFHDERGRELTGPELAYLTPSHAEGEASSGPLFEVEASSEGVEDRVRYAPADPDPVAKTRPVSSASSASASGASAEIRWEIRYDVRPTVVDCLYRNVLQGDALATGARVGDPCPGADLDASWWTGEPETQRGLTTVPQYGVDDAEDPRSVAKLVWAEGIPYPIQVDTITVGVDGDEADRFAANLTNLTRAGEPLAQDAAPRGPASIDRAPLAPLDGPQLRSAEAVPFPLADASQAARQDPTLTELQALLEDEDAVLAGAQLLPDEDTDAGEARTLTWTLAYTAPDEGPILVECQRPVGQAQGNALAPPAAECRETDQPREAADHLTQVPARGTQALPSQAATWDAALDRWRLLDPDNASAPLELARYQPLADENSRGPRTAQFAVGTPGGQAQAGATGSSEVPTTVALALGSGETLTHTTGVKSHQGLTQPADALSSAASAGPGGEGIRFGGGDPVVGAATGAGLLGLIALAVWALYSRLQGDEVLAHDTRQQIRDLVEVEPGIHGSAIARQVDANERTVEHHVDVLVREDVLAELERGGYNHYFVQGQHSPKRMQALASLQRGKAEAVYEAVRQDPGLDTTTLAERAEISKAYASKLVSQLVDVGLVDKVREGRRSRLYANPVSEGGD
jgi:DNA-binding transcriptional ArsR family regulator